MALPTIPLLAPVPVDPAVAALPKADLHLHQGAAARLERLAASRLRRPPYDRRGWAARLIADWPHDLGRLGGVYKPDDDLDLIGIQRRDPERPAPRCDGIWRSIADGANVDICGFCCGSCSRISAGLYSVVGVGRPLRGGA